MDRYFGQYGEQIATKVEDKATDIKIELSAEDTNLVAGIGDDGLRAHRKKALTQLSGILFEVMDLGKSERTGMKVGKA